MFDHQEISRDLIRALRGKRSQPMLSRQLGFRSNVVYSWEHGRRYPEVSLFLRTALRSRSELVRDLALFFGLDDTAFGGRRGYSPRTVTELVLRLAGTVPKSRLALELGVDRTTLGRWCAGKTEPRLPEFLALIQASTQRLLAFVALFADPSTLPSTRQVHQHLVHQQRLAYEHPHSHAVLRALELEQYRALPAHSTAFIAHEVGIEVRQAEQLLRRLVRAGQAIRHGRHYRAAEILTVDTREDPARNRRLKSFWAREALTRLDAGTSAEEALFSFNLFAISEQGLQQIRELHLAHFDRVRAIIEKNQTSEHVVLMNLQLVPLRAAPLS